MNKPIFDIQAIKIGDKVRLGNPEKMAECFGVVERVKITSTIVYYEVKISHYWAKPKHIGKVFQFPHGVVRLNDNEPDMLLKSIL